MKKSVALLAFFTAVQVSYAQDVYFPPSGKWERKDPLVSGFDTAKLNDAIRFALANESKAPRSMQLAQAQSFGKEPHGEPIGPFADRGNPTGIILHKGYIIAEWGEPARVDMTHSVTKSFLSTVVGLALDKGLIKSLEDKVSDYVGTLELYNTEAEMISPFASTHNRKINWETMLRQSSDWEGTLWGKPDWADRPDKDSTKWHNRKRNEPGSVFEYNDVRVNALALAATVVWKKALPEVLKEHVMNPIGASATWQWQGYKNSWILLKEDVIQSVSGGGHWGGGMFINAYDMARFGWFTLNEGNWDGRQIISKQWFQRATTPSTGNKFYGYMNYYLNTNKESFPTAPSSVYFHLGNGANVIYVDKENQLVMVVRWIESRAIPEMVKKLVDSKTN